MLVLIKQLSAKEFYHQLDFSYECFVSYLKQQNACDEYLCSITADIEIGDACENGVYIEKENLLEQILLTLASSENFNCIRSGLRKNEEFNNLLLNLRVVKSMSGILQKLSSLITGTRPQKEKAIERIEKQLQDILLTADEMCFVLWVFFDFLVKPFFFVV